MADLIILSSEDEEILTCASKFGIELHHRSELNSSDEATTESVIMEVIRDLNLNKSSLDSISIVQVTSPFISASSINSCIGLAEQGKSAFTAIENNSFRWTMVDKKWIPFGHPHNYRPRRQELALEVVETGGCYSFTVADFIENEYRFCSDPYPVLVGWEEALDIDTLEDLKIANFIAASTPITETSKKLTPRPKIIVTDFDGCLTDDHVQVNELGVESISANRKDGLAAKIIESFGIKILILSSEKNPVVSVRAKKMGLDVIQGSSNKLANLLDFLEQHEFALEDTWYIGNDLNDFDVMTKVGKSFCPNDSVKAIRSIADVIMNKNGGEGILEEILTYIGDEYHE